SSQTVAGDRTEMVNVSRQQSGNGVAYEDCEWPSGQRVGDGGRAIVCRRAVLKIPTGGRTFRVNGGPEDGIAAGNRSWTERGDYRQARERGEGLVGAGHDPIVVRGNHLIMIERVGQQAGKKIGD